MRARDALRLRALIVLYGLARGLAFLFESPASRRWWTIFLISIAVGFGALGLHVDTHCLPSPPRSLVAPHSDGDRFPPSNLRVCSWRAAGERIEPYATEAPERAAKPRHEHARRGPAETGHHHCAELLDVSARSSMPFLEAFNPVRRIGDVFEYEEHPGYQVPLTFRFAEPLGPIASASLQIEARVRTRRDQLQGTEAIWIDGVLSGRPYPHFVNWQRVTFADPSNTTFVDELDDCCRRRSGTARYTLDELIAGSGWSLSDLFDDGELEVVISDDTEILSAELTVCEVGVRRCTVVRPR
jgi:hypothetical protein